MLNLFKRKSAIEGFEDSVQETFTQARTKFHKETDYCISILALVIGLPMTFFGVYARRITMTIICAIGLIHFEPELLANLCEGRVFGFSLKDVLKDVLPQLFEPIYESELFFIIITSILAILLCFILFSFVDLASFLFCLYGAYICFAKGILQSFFTFLAIENYLLKALIIVISCICAYFFYKILQNTIFLVLFSSFGSFLTCYGLDKVFKLGFNMEELFIEVFLNRNFTALYTEVNLLWWTMFMVGFGLQFSTIFKTK